nr:unnamed protein product [Digitaria exilis]
MNKLQKFIHPSLHGIAFCSKGLPKCLSFSARKRRLCVRVALLCIQEKPERRPDMVEVIRMLLSPKKAKTPFPRRPGYANARESSMYAGDRSTTNP